MMLGMSTYQRGAAQAAVSVASSFELQRVDLRCGENGHCDISQGQTQVNMLAMHGVVRLSA